MISGWLRVVVDNSLLLIAGALAALIWANVDPTSYLHASHALQFAVNDVAMVLFFALAAKEVVDAMLPGGALSSSRAAALPIVAAVGGMAVPAVIFLGGARMTGHVDLTRGWAIPCATDIAFSYLAARLIFPKQSPAIPFLLLLAIADDALGLIVLAIFYPSAPISLTFLALGLIPALLVAWTMRRAHVRNFWAYLAGPGVLAWVALYAGGIHPALALVPIVPFIPSSEKERFARAWQLPVQIALFFFGLANAGVPFSSVGPATWLVLGGLMLGKPIGVVGMTLLAEFAGLRRPAALDVRSLVALGAAAGIGFTVALFFATAAFAPGATLDHAKMGALLSFLAAPLAIVLARLLRLPRIA